MAVNPASRGEQPAIAAEAFRRALADNAADYLFANPGTDFPPIIEAFSRAKRTNAKVPKPVLVPHENRAGALLNVICPY
jgi:acetolactate synthase-1/2/3 large subunit